MNKQISEMLCASEGRYLTRAELASLRELAAQLEVRVLAMEEIQAKEDAIVERTLKDVTTAYPDYLNRHKDARSGVCASVRNARDAAQRSGIP